MVSLRRRTLSLFLASLVACTALLSFSFLPTGTLFSASKAHANPSYDGTMLMMIHGYFDDCTAFNEARPYFDLHGWGNGPNLGDRIDLVGYYTYEQGGGDSGCTGDSLQDATMLQHCTSLETTSYNRATGITHDNGTRSDTIVHLACLLAWDIYNKGITVDVLAHSMGGLLIRIALGCSGYSATICTYRSSTNHNDFPTQKLAVRRVVTVGTPHKGLDDGAQNATLFYGETDKKEVIDMESSTFVADLNSIQKPQGSGQGTYWALMASSGLCVGGIGDATGGCKAAAGGDGLLGADTTLQMQADFKVLYGAPGQGNTVVQHYAHAPAPGSCPPNCLQRPFYLSDMGDGDNVLTQAWVCGGQCNSTDGNLNDMATNGPGVSFRPSLPEMAALLAPPELNFSYADANIDGRKEFFFVSAGNDVFHSWQSSTGARLGSPQLLASSPAGSNGFTGSPVAAEDMDGRLEVFALDNNGFIWHIWQGANAGWSNWSQMPTNQRFNGGLAVILNADGRLELFARGQDNYIWHVWQNASEGGWSTGFDQLPTNTPFSSAPAVVVNYNKTLDVVARDSNGHIWDLGQTSPGAWWNSWQLWTDNPSLIGNPALGLDQNGALEIFSRGNNNNIWRSWRDSPSSGHSQWHEIQTNNAFVGDPVVGQDTDGRLEIFARGSNNNIWHIWEQHPNGNSNTVGNWADNWSELAANVAQSGGQTISPGGYFSNDPAVIRNSTNDSNTQYNKMALVAQDSNRHWWTNAYDINNGWRPYWMFI